jgi:periplasmic protein TonB
VRGLRLPLALSVAGHAIFLSMLVWLSARLSPLMLSPPSPPKGVTVIFAPPPQPPPPAPKPVAVKPPPVVAKPPPPPPPKVVAAPKPPPVVRHVEAEPRPVRRREVRRRIEHRVRRREVERRRPPPRTVPPQTAALPPPAPVRRPPPAPIISPAYSSALAEWFAAHRRYPESAQERGEEGMGVLRLQIDRSGQVLSQTLVRSTGYPDLDRAIEATMRGAVLPPFPAVMAESEREITVTIPFQFRLER